MMRLIAFEAFPLTHSTVNTVHLHLRMVMVSVMERTWSLFDVNRKWPK